MARQSFLITFETSTRIVSVTGGTSMFWRLFDCWLSSPEVLSGLLLGWLEPDPELDPEPELTEFKLTLFDAIL